MLPLNPSGVEWRSCLQKYDLFHFLIKYNVVLFFLHFLQTKLNTKHELQLETFYGIDRLELALLFVCVSDIFFIEGTTF